MTNARAASLDASDSDSDSWFAPTIFASCSGTTTSAVSMLPTVATRPCAVTASKGWPMPVRVRKLQYSASPTSLIAGFTSYSRS